jgi:hypothetical protein
MNPSCGGGPPDFVSIDKTGNKITSFFIASDTIFADVYNRDGRKLMPRKILITHADYASYDPAGWLTGVKELNSGTGISYSYGDNCSKADPRRFEDFYIYDSNLTCTGKTAARTFNQIYVVQNAGNTIYINGLEPSPIDTSATYAEVYNAGTMNHDGFLQLSPFHCAIEAMTIAPGPSSYLVFVTEGRSSQSIPYVRSFTPGVGTTTAEQGPLTVPGFSDILVQNVWKTPPGAPSSYLIIFQKWIVKSASWGGTTELYMVYADDNIRVQGTPQMIAAADTAKHNVESIVSIDGKYLIRWFDWDTPNLWYMDDYQLFNYALQPASERKRSVKLNGGDFFNMDTLKSFYRLDDTTAFVLQDKPVSANEKISTGRVVKFRAEFPYGNVRLAGLPARKALHTEGKFILYNLSGRKILVSDRPFSARQRMAAGIGIVLREHQNRACTKYVIFNR